MGKFDIPSKYHDLNTAIDAYYSDVAGSDDSVRAVYDAAATILYPDGNYDEPDGFDAAADLWQLRADYIDAHAIAYNDATEPNYDAEDAARDALVAALAGNKVTEARQR